MTRQRAQALKRKPLRGEQEKPIRSVRAKRGLAEAESAMKEVKEESIPDEEAKQKRSRAQLIKKLKITKEETQAIPQKSGNNETLTTESRLESSAKLPLKKRMTIRNEIEEFVNQRRQVEIKHSSCVRRNKLKPLFVHRLKKIGSGIRTSFR